MAPTTMKTVRTEATKLGLSADFLSSSISLKTSFFFDMVFSFPWGLIAPCCPRLWQGQGVAINRDTIPFQGIDLGIRQER